MAWPVEGLVGKRHLLNRSSYLLVNKDFLMFFVTTAHAHISERFFVLTGKSTMGTVSVTAVSTATRTHSIRTS